MSALSPAALRLLLPGQQRYKGHGDGHHGAGQPSGDDPAAADALGGEIQGESLNSYHTFHLVSVWSSREERGGTLELVLSVLTTVNKLSQGFSNMTMIKEL